MLQVKHHLSGLNRNRKANIHHRCVFSIYLYAVYLIELFDQRLGHGGLGCLSSEFFDESLGLLDLLFLIFLSAELLFSDLVAHGHKSRKWFLIVVDAPQRDLNGAVGHVV